MLEIIAHTDGSCLGNPGVGGYAARMEAKGKKLSFAKDTRLKTQRITEWNSALLFVC